MSFVSDRLQPTSLPDGGRPITGRQQLSEEAASHIRDLITAGRLKAGSFVRLDQIARELGISTTPVREGLLLLRGEGLVTLEPRRGFAVQPLTQGDIIDAFWLQSELAGELAYRAAGLITDESLERLNTFQEQIDAALVANLPERIDDLNYQFHRLVNRHAEAPVLLRFLSQSLKYVPRRFFSTIAGWPHASVQDHRSVLDALAVRDPEAARDAMSEHIRHAGRLLSDYLTRIANETNDDG